MSGNYRPSPAKLTISEVLLRFFLVQSQRLSKDTSWNYLWVLYRFQEYLNRYGRTGVRDASKEQTGRQE